VFRILNTPTAQEDIVTVTDPLGQSLLEAIDGTKATPALFDENTTLL